MSEFLDGIIVRAKADKQTIVLPEGNDERTLQAAQNVLEQDIANVIILGDEAAIRKSSYRLDGAQIVDPSTSDKTEGFAETLAKLREKKGLTLDQAREMVKDVLYFGVMMVYSGLADGMVSGACHATGDVLRPALQILKTAPGTKLVSAFFLMAVPDCPYGDKGRFVFADCALNQNPNAEELSEIAIASAASYKSLVGSEPKVAMLSYSTYGSAHSELVDKVVEATRMAREKAPQLALDGELQLDAAIVDSVAKSKAPQSAVAGQANVLVFPDLNAGNIGYKLVQRLGKAEAYGPILQGIARPVNDLSRGCTADDITGVIAVTCVQSQNRKAQDR